MVDASAWALEPLASPPRPSAAQEHKVLGITSLFSTWGALWKEQRPSAPRFDRQTARIRATPKTFITSHCTSSPYANPYRVYESWRATRKFQNALLRIESFGRERGGCRRSVDFATIRGHLIGLNSNPNRSEGPAGAPAMLTAGLPDGIEQTNA